MDKTTINADFMNTKAEKESLIFVLNIGQSWIIAIATYNHYYNEKILLKNNHSNKPDLAAFYFHILTFITM